MSKYDVKYEISMHDGKSVIFIRFEYHAELSERARKLTGAKWSNSQKAWYVTDSQHYRQKFGLEAKPLAGKEVIAQISDVNQPALQKYIETLELKAYSPNTIRTYVNEFAQLLYVMKNNPVDELSADKLRSYILYCIKTLKLTENTIISRINAIKFFRSGDPV